MHETILMHNEYLKIDHYNASSVVILFPLINSICLMWLLQHDPRTYKLYMFDVAAPA